MQIQIQNLDDDGQVFEFRTEDLPTLLGSHSDADVQLADPLVEPLHCMIDADEHGLTVLALSTRSGTLVNGKRVVESPLASGDCLMVGRTCLTVKYGPPRKSAGEGGTEHHADPAKPR